VPLKEIGIIFAIYVVVGPLAWALLALAMFMGRSRMARLANWRGELPKPPPHVSILVPAKDEGEHIRRCIESILSQDYPDFSIIAINDRSTDDTGPIIDALAKEHRRLRVVHIESLPSGWLGKCHALWSGAKLADANDWLFFVDSDVTLKRNALSTALSLAVAREYDVLTLLTALECHTFLERLILPLAAAAWSIMFTISLTNDDNRKQIATANGQFLLIRRAVYDSVGGHEAVKDKIVEDVELARLLKSKGYSIRFFSGDHLASTRMHATLKQMFNGWGRIYSGTSRRKIGRIVLAMIFLMAGSFSVYPAMIWGSVQHDPRWLIASLAHLAVMTAMLALIYKWARNPAPFAALFPISGTILLAILAFALRVCRTGRVQWRNTTYDTTATTT
jgi:chlorobactene glucosyltransferase